MTLDDLLTLSPSSPELDEAVSRRVMGFTRRTPCFHPSSRRGDAFKVVESMHRNGHMVEITQSHDGVWRVMFWVGRLGFRRRLHADVRSESLSEAVCKAALTALLTPRGDEGRTPPNRPDIGHARKTMRITPVSGKEDE